MIALGAIALVVPGAAHAARGKTVRTGQKNDFGAPGATTAGITRSYVDNGLGFVKDQRTGLWWEKKSDDGGIHDKDDAYTWTTDTKVADGTAFTEFLSALNTEPCFAGHSDWRLPTSFELYTIVDMGFSLPTVGPMFDAGCLPGCGIETCNCTNGGGFWTSSTPKDFQDLAWLVDFGNGAVVLGFKTQSYFVRAVRSDQP
ncbi:MAG: DUF1566 domain-containing protein [Alphaproteobacteria bacterium]